MSNLEKSWIGTIFSGVFTLAQTREVFQIICLVLTCLSVLLSITSSIISWYRKSSADGKITKEEIKEGAQIINDGVNQIQEVIKNKEEK